MLQTVHIYTKAAGASKQWVLSGSVTAGTFAAAGQFFGSSVAISQGGKVLVVGAAADGPGRPVGQVYIFRLDSAARARGTQGRRFTYTLVTRLVGATSTDSLYGLGVSVTADGMTVAVASPNPDAVGGINPKVYVYSSDKTQSTYTQTAVCGRAGVQLGRSAGALARWGDAGHVRRVG